MNLILLSLQALKNKRLGIYFQMDSIVLKNGIKLIHKQSNSDVAHLGIIINSGTRDELSNEFGLAHYIEHVIFKGTNKRKSYHILSRMDDVGGEINAYTTKEDTTIHATFLTKYYDRAADLISDIVFNSSFPEKEIKKEKEVVIDEINSYKDSPAELIFDDIEDLLFEGKALGHNILGTKKNVRKFNRKSIDQFINRTYATDQMVISSVGNISFAKLHKYIQKYFDHIPASTYSREVENYDNYIPQIKTINKKTFQTHCMIANHAYKLTHPNRLSLFLLNNLLGGPALNSRLNLSIREKHGFAYNVDSNYHAFTDTGIFAIYFGTDKNNVDKSLQLIEKELDRLKSEKLGTLQLSKAKLQLIGQLAISSESNENKMLSIGKSYLHFNKVDKLATVIEKINAIKAENLQEIANEVFNFDKMSILTYK